MSSEKWGGFFNGNSQTTQKNTIDSVFVHNMKPRCSLLITGNFKHDSNIKKKFLEPLNLGKMDDFEWSNDFKITNQDDLELVLFDVCTVNKFNHFGFYSGAGIIIAIPTSADDLHTSYCHIVNSRYKRDENTIHAYLNLFEEGSKEYDAIEDMAKTLKFEKCKIPKSKASTAEQLLELSIRRAKTMYKKVLKEHNVDPNNIKPDPQEEKTCVIL